MLITLLAIYLAGCVLVTLGFVVMVLYLYSCNTSDSRYLAKEYIKMAGQHIIFWPWRIVGFQLYIRVKKPRGARLE